MLGFYCYIVCYKYYNLYNLQLIMEFQELRVDVFVFVLFVEFFDMEGYNRYFIGDTICYDFIVRLDKIR